MSKENPINNLKNSDPQANILKNQEGQNGGPKSESKSEQTIPSLLKVLKYKFLNGKITPTEFREKLTEADQSEGTRSASVPIYYLLKEEAIQKFYINLGHCPYPIDFNLISLCFAMYKYKLASNISFVLE